MAITQISKAAPQVTNFGPVGGSYRKSITAISDGQNAQQTTGLIGSTAPLQFGSVASVAINQTNVVQTRIRLLADCRLISVERAVGTVVATATFDIFDETNSAAVTGANALTSNTTAEITTFSSNAERILAAGTVLQLRANTDGTGTIANLNVTLNVEILSTPGGQRNYD